MSCIHVGFHFMITLTYAFQVDYNRNTWHSDFVNKKHKDKWGSKTESKMKCSQETKSKTDHSMKPVIDHEIAVIESLVLVLLCEVGFSSLFLVLMT